MSGLLIRAFPVSDKIDFLFTMGNKWGIPPDKFSVEKVIYPLSIGFLSLFKILKKFKEKWDIMMHYIYDRTQDVFFSNIKLHQSRLTLSMMKNCEDSLKWFDIHGWITLVPVLWTAGLENIRKYFCHMRGLCFRSLCNFLSVKAFFFAKKRRAPNIRQMRWPGTIAPPAPLP